MKFIAATFISNWNKRSSIQCSLNVFFKVELTKKKKLNGKTFSNHNFFSKNLYRWKSLMKTSKLKIYMKESLYQIWGLFEQRSWETSSSTFYNQSTFVVLQPWKGKGLKKYFLWASMNRHRYMFCREPLSD